DHRCSGEVWLGLAVNDDRIGNLRQSRRRLNRMRPCAGDVEGNGIHKADISISGVDRFTQRTFAYIARAITGVSSRVDGKHGFDLWRTQSGQRGYESRDWYTGRRKHL